MKVTFVLADTFETQTRLVYENEHVPYRKRTVTIELTSEQYEQIRPVQVGVDRGKPHFEIFVECFIEHDPNKYGDEESDENG
jgi:hypothetical protein